MMGFPCFDCAEHTKARIWLIYWGKLLKRKAKKARGEALP